MASSKRFLNYRKEQALTPEIFVQPLLNMDFVLDSKIGHMQAELANCNSSV